jgi:hypothetical protein
MAIDMTDVCQNTEYTLCSSGENDNIKYPDYDPPSPRAKTKDIACHRRSLFVSFEKLNTNSQFEKKI